MDYLGLLWSGAQYCYNNINGSNMSGANDVIIVRQQDGTYKSTPFHVRFGKMGVLLPRAHMVEIFINGQLVKDIHMRIGATGHAFFEPSILSERGKEKDKSDQNTPLPTNSVKPRTHGNNNPVNRVSPSGIQNSTPSSTDKPIDKESMMNTTEMFKQFSSFLAEPSNWPKDFNVFIIGSDGVELNVTVDQLALKVHNFDRDQLFVRWSGTCMHWTKASELLDLDSSNQTADTLSVGLHCNSDTLSGGASAGYDETATEYIPSKSSNDTFEKELTISSTPPPNEGLLHPFRKPIHLPLFTSAGPDVEYESNADDCESDDDQLNRTVTSTLMGETNSDIPLEEEVGYLSDENNQRVPRQAGPTYRRRSLKTRRLSLLGTEVLTSDQLKSLQLNDGENEAVFSVITKYQGTCQCSCYIYLWDWTAKVVISDIDGTITKSDVLGYLMPLLGIEWIHPKVVELYNKIARNGYQFLYLSSRAIGQARVTRKFLYDVRQNGVQLPDGPILLAPISMLRAFRKEVIERRAEENKIACLLRVIELFQQTSPTPDCHLPTAIMAGFGNRPSDVKTYKAVGLADSQIFTVNHLSKIVCGSQPESPVVDLKLDLNHPDATSKMMTPISGRMSLTYDALLSMADSYFPPDRDRMCFAENYSDFAFWRT